MPIRVVVADDHALFRAGVIRLLQLLPEIEVIGEAGTGPEIVALAGQTKPDVVLLDVDMPGPGARAVIRDVRRNSPQSRIVISTVHDSAVMARKLIHAGANAYVAKNATGDELTEAIHAVHRSECNVLISVTSGAARGVTSRNAVAPVLSLTEREEQILQLISDGLGNAAIARRLLISESTVKRHIANLYAKLNATSRVDAVHQGERLDLIAQNGTATA